MSSPMNISPSTQTHTSMYMQLNERDYSHTKFMHKFTNCMVKSNLEWFDGKDPPPHDKKEYPVVLCYSKQDDDFQVCYWDGGRFLCMSDDMPFLATLWTYLPDTNL